MTTALCLHRRILHFFHLLFVLWQPRFEHRSCRKVALQLSIMNEARGTDTPRARETVYAWEFMLLDRLRPEIRLVKAPLLGQQ